MRVAKKHLNCKSIIFNVNAFLYFVVLCCAIFYCYCVVLYCAVHVLHCVGLYFVDIFCCVILVLCCVIVLCYIMLPVFHY